MCGRCDKMQVVYKELTRESKRMRRGGGGGARMGEKELTSMRRESFVSDALEKFLRR